MVKRPYSALVALLKAAPSLAYVIALIVMGANNIHPVLNVLGVLYSVSMLKNAYYAFFG